MTPETPLVAIRCFTYNQAAYIRQCLDGFVMQRTDFAFVAIVHDDCSTDGTDDIVREYAQRYPHIIKPIFETENQYSKGDGSLSRIMTQACNNTGAKYIAMCEGDDYWTDPLKLQKQVDFLEKHPECSLCYHAFRYHYENPDDGVDHFKRVLPEYSAADILSSVQFQTATTVVRKEIFETEQYKALTSIGFAFGDILLFLSCAEYGRIMGIDDVMSVYRVSNQGVTRNTLNTINRRVLHLELWCKATTILKKETSEAIHQEIIIPGISNCFFNLVIRKQIPIKRWFNIYKSEIKLRKKSLFEVPIVMFKRFIKLFTTRGGYFSRIINYPTYIYRRLFIPDYEHIGNTIPTEWISDYDEVSELIYTLLDSNKPCMIARFGVTEFMCMENFIKGHHPFWWLRSIWPFWVKKEVITNMTELSGFFGAKGYKSYVRFADLLYSCGKQTDILACWYKNQSIIEKEMSYSIIWLLSFEPWWSNCPWTRYLKGKKVLVVHPFADSIKEQYSRRETLFDNPNILPEFASLTIIKAIQSLGGENNGFSDWFEALKYMQDQIDAVDYDIALIGYGAYGMPLAAHCKQMGKKAIHFGGALQLLFGIKGNRWLNNYGNNKDYIPDYKTLLSNPNWIKPKESETPSNANAVEKACYW